MWKNSGHCVWISDAVASFYFYLIILNFAVCPCLFFMQNIKYFCQFRFLFCLYTFFSVQIKIQMLITSWRTWQYSAKASQGLCKSLGLLTVFPHFFLGTRKNLESVQLLKSASLLSSSYLFTNQDLSLSKTNQHFLKWLSFSGELRSAAIFHFKTINQCYRKFCCLKCLTMLQNI